MKPGGSVTFRDEDGPERREVFLGSAAHERVAVIPPVLKLLQGILEPQIPLRLAFGGPFTKPRHELATAGGKDENVHQRLANPWLCGQADMFSPLHIKVHQHVAPLFDVPADFTFEGAVEISVDPRPLDKFARGDSFPKGVFIEKMVIPPVLLAASGQSSGGGNSIAALVWLETAQSTTEGGLSGTTGTGDNTKNASAGHAGENKDEKGTVKSGARSRAPDQSLEILHLFPDLFHFCLGGDDQVSNPGIVAFGTDGVDFPLQFLTKEIERPAGRFNAG